MKGYDMHECKSDVHALLAIIDLAASELQREPQQVTLLGKPPARMW